MAQDVRLGAPGVASRRRREPHNTLEMLKSNLDAPSQSIRAPIAESGYSSRSSDVMMMTHCAATNVWGRTARHLSRALRLIFSIERSRACLGLRIATRRNFIGFFAEVLITIGWSISPLPQFFLRHAMRSKHLPAASNQQAAFHLARVTISAPPSSTFPTRSAWR